MGKPPVVNSPPPTPRATTGRSFSVAPWVGEGQGEKIILYGPPGMGKTTLASMAPDPVFIGCDDGGRKIKNPKTGQPVVAVQGIATFGDVRQVLQSDVFEDHQTVVLDTVTMLQHWALPWMFATIKHEKGGTVNSIEGYGYGKGYRHLFDLMHLILTDCDRLVRTGKNVILIAQASAVPEKNTSGEDYLKDGPDLHHATNTSVRKDYISWSDHVLRVTWEGATIEDRKITPVKGRCVNVHPDATFESKSRTLPPDTDTVTFSGPTDDSIWQFLFGGAS